MTFLHTVDVAWPELPSDTDWIEAFARRAVGALFVRGLYAPDQAAELARRLEQGTHGFPRSAFPPEFGVDVLGQCLDLAEPPLETYFAHAAAFRAACRRACEGLPDFEERVAVVLGALGTGRPVAVPRGPGGETYAPSTVRRMVAGGYIPPHCEKEQSKRPPYHHLRDVIDTELMLSFYLVLQAPEAGGALGVSALQWSDLGPAQMNNQRTSVEGILDRYDRTLLTPAPGDLILFDGGSRVHWVSPVGGDRPRYTIGGFVSRSRDRETIYYWS